MTKEQVEVFRAQADSDIRNGEPVSALPAYHLRELCASHEALRESAEEMEAMFRDDNPESVNSIALNALRNLSPERVENLAKALSGRYCQLEEKNQLLRSELHELKIDVGEAARLLNVAGPLSHRVQVYKSEYSRTITDLKDAIAQLEARNRELEHIRIRNDHKP